MSFALHASRAVCRVLDALAAQGLTVAESDDFSAFKTRYEAFRGVPVNPAFDIGRQAVEGLWLALEDQNGACCGIQEVRFLGPAAGDLASHLAVRLEDFVPLGHGVAAATSQVVSAAAQGMRGTLAYHGEFYIAPAYRRRGLAALTIRLGQLAAWLSWRPDIFFGITVPASSSQAFADRMGYGGFEKRAIVWRDAAGTHRYDEGLVWSGPAHLRALSKAPVPGRRWPATHLALSRAAEQ